MNDRAKSCDKSVENIERLRESKTKADLLHCEEGREHGRAWAEKLAEYYELAAFARLDVQGEARGQGEGALAELIVAREGFEHLRDVLINEDHPFTPNAYVLAFHEAAADFFNAIEGKI